MNNSFVAPPMSRDDFRRWGFRVRKQLGIEGKLYFPIVQVFEWFLPEGWEYDIASVREMGNLHGQTLPLEKVVKIREDIYDRAVEGHGRDRFTVAHELAHVCFHGNIVTLARADPTKEIKTYVQPEWQADVAAGELLIPCYLIKDYGIEEISRYCHVSLDAAKTQKRFSHKAGYVKLT